MEARGAGPGFDGSDEGGGGVGAGSPVRAPGLAVPGEVGGEGFGGAAGRADGGDGGLRLGLRRPVVDGHAEAVARQREGDRAPDPFGGTCDECGAHGGYGREAR